MSTSPTPFSEQTFLGRGSRLSRAVALPIVRYTQVEAAAGIMLVAATAIALIWANSGWSGGYDSLWHTPFHLEIGSFVLGGSHHLDLAAVVNDGLMAVFFFVVGMEIKRELVSGHLKSPKAAALPAIAALGGMVVPATIYFAFNRGTDAAGGWGIPMATDIAFAVGVVSLLGNRVPRQLTIFLLTLAVVDDIGAIIVIAIFYSASVSFAWLAAAGGIVAVVCALRALRVWYVPVYVMLGVALWVCMLQSGVHATIAGVILGLLTPAVPLQSKAEASRWASWLRDKEEVFPVDIRFASFHIRESQSVAERLVTAIHPFSAFVILPIFALANAGVPLSGEALKAAATSQVTLGVALGLVVGKAVGIFIFTWIAAKTPIATMPAGMGAPQLGGLAIMGGVGFTVSLFVTGLAFDNPAFAAEAKIGILGASLAASVLGLAVLARATRPATVTAPATAPVDLGTPVPA